MKDIRFLWTALQVGGINVKLVATGRSKSPDRGDRCLRKSSWCFGWMCREDLQPVFYCHARVDFRRTSSHHVISHTCLLRVSLNVIRPQQTPQNHSWCLINSCIHKTNRFPSFCRHSDGGSDHTKPWDWPGVWTGRGFQWEGSEKAAATKKKGKKPASIIWLFVKTMQATFHRNNNRDTFLCLTESTHLAPAVIGKQFSLIQTLPES